MRGMADSQSPSDKISVNWIAAYNDHQVAKLLGIVGLAEDGSCTPHSLRAAT
jgi:hypothetical protein